MGCFQRLSFGDGGRIITGGTDGGIERGAGEAQEAQEEEDVEVLYDVALAIRQTVKISETIAKLLDLESSHIVVRSECEEAERAALVANANRIHAVLVCGQSGIGMSLSFLILICVT